MTTSIEGITALVTGASRGIGRAVVAALQDAGAGKIYLGVRDVESVGDLVAQDPDRLIPVLLDVTKPDQVRAAAETIIDLGLLVNNAGILEPGGFIGTSNDAGARAEMEVNYFGTLSVTRAFAPALAASGGGAVVNLSSVAGLVNFPIFGSYSASKAAVHSLTQGLRGELSKQGTQVIGVYPGPVDTDMGRNLEIDKVPASTIAQAILKAVRNGEEDVYPDPMADNVRDELARDPKGFEKQVAEMFQ